MGPEQRVRISHRGFRVSRLRGLRVQGLGFRVSRLRGLRVQGQGVLSIVTRFSMGSCHKRDNIAN